LTLSVLDFAAGPCFVPVSVYNLPVREALPRNITSSSLPNIQE
jgi:hypothetical protein